MKKKDALRIIRDENLVKYSFFENRADQEYEVVIKEKDDHWEVYTTDERAAIHGTRGIYETETEALCNFIKRLRAGKLLYSLIQICF
jgi:hypothetical protein